MKKLLLALGALGLAAQAQAATNLITNGDFEAGNTDFTSDYSYVPSALTNGSSLYTEGTYTVGTDANLYHNLWVSRTDHTSGAGNYLIVNGSTSNVGDKDVWKSDSIALAPGIYDFSAYFTDICCTAASGVVDSPAVLTFLTNNGVQTVGLGTSTVGTTGMWLQGSATLTVLANTTAQVSLRNASSVSSGNDFGIDDISLVKVGGVPEAATWAMMVVGFGTVGAATRRRRTSLTFS